MTQGRERTDAERATLRSVFGRDGDVLRALVIEPAPPAVDHDPTEDLPPRESWGDVRAANHRPEQPRPRAIIAAMTIGAVAGAAVLAGVVAMGLLRMPRMPAPDYVLEAAASDLHAELPRPELDDIRVFDLERGLVFAGTGADGRSCLQFVPVPNDVTDPDVFYASEPTCALAPLRPRITQWAETPLQNGTLFDLPTSSALHMEADGNRLRMWVVDVSELAG